MKTDAELAAEGWERTESASRGVRWERGGRTCERDEVEAILVMIKEERIEALQEARSIVDDISVDPELRSESAYHEGHGACSEAIDHRICVAIAKERTR